MALGEDLLKGGNLASGIGVGIGMALLAPVLLPVIGAVVRPVAKTAIKMGMVAYDSAAEGVSSMAGGAAGAAGGTGLGALFREAREEVDAARTSQSERGRDKSAAHSSGSSRATA